MKLFSPFITRDHKLIPGDIFVRIVMLTRFSCSSSTGHVLSLAASLNWLGFRAAVVMTGCPAPLQQQYQIYCQNRVPIVFENREAEIAGALRHYRADLIHVHSPTLIPMARSPAHSLRLPWGMSIHNGLLPFQQGALNQAAFIIAGDLHTVYKLKNLGYPATFIPEGIDLDEFKPEEKKGFRVAFIGEAGGYTGDGIEAALKAAALADLPVDVICPEQFPLLQGRSYGWLPSSSPVLRGAQIVIGRRRSLLEGMACGCAAMILGDNYGGIVEAWAFESTAGPDLSGANSKAPCYRNIFFDLFRLLKDRAYLADLQYRGRKYITENCDLRLAAELTAKMYRDGIKNTKSGRR